MRLFVDHLDCCSASGLKELRNHLLELKFTANTRFDTWSADWQVELETRVGRVAREREQSQLVLLRTRAVCLIERNSCFSQINPLPITEQIILQQFSLAQINSGQLFMASFDAIWRRKK